jgi:hypothetical protein
MLIYTTWNITKEINRKVFKGSQTTWRGGDIQAGNEFEKTSLWDAKYNLVLSCYLSIWLFKLESLLFLMYIKLLALLCLNDMVVLLLMFLKKKNVDH